MGRLGRTTTRPRRSCTSTAACSWSRSPKGSGSDAPAAEIRGRVGPLVPFVSSGSFSRTSRKHSGLADVHVHQARHTYAMTWLGEGGSLAALQEVLGHQDFEDDPNLRARDR
jgi:integrase